MDLQVTRTRASRLPGYSASAVSSSRNGANAASRTQSADRKPVAATTARTVVKQQHAGRSAVDTHCGRSHTDTSRDLLTPSTVIDTDVISADVPTAITANSRLGGEETATKQPVPRGKASHLRPPKTIVARQSWHRHQSNDVAAVAADTGDVPPRHGRLIRHMNETFFILFCVAVCG